jgi:hypothetical protein
MTTLFVSYSPFIINISQLEMINLKCAHNIIQLHTIETHLQIYKNTCLFVLHVLATHVTIIRKIIPYTEILYSLCLYAVKTTGNRQNNAIICVTL